MGDVTIVAASCDSCGQELGPNEVSVPDGWDYRYIARMGCWPLVLPGDLLRQEGFFHRREPFKWGEHCGRVLFATEAS